MEKKMTIDELQNTITALHINCKNITVKKRLNNGKEFVDNRLYCNFHEQFINYFIVFENKPFLKTYIARPKGFDFVGQKQSDLETQRCKKAKRQFLNALRKSLIENHLSIENLEHYEKDDDVIISPKSTKIKFNFDEKE